MGLKWRFIGRRASFSGTGSSSNYLMSYCVRRGKGLLAGRGLGALFRLYDGLRKGGRGGGPTLLRAVRERGDFCVDLEVRSEARKVKSLIQLITRCAQLIADSGLPAHVD